MHLYFLLLLASAAIYEAQAAGTSCNCGWVNSGRIVGGKEAVKNKYPMIAALVRPWGHQFCGGTILTPWHVVTAAHCTHKTKISDIQVKVGAHDLRSSGTTYHISKYINHEKFVYESAIFDISLLVTAKPMQFNQLVGPACLPNSKLNINGQILTALGWGKMENGKSSDNLREVQLRVVDFQECSRKWGGSGPRADNNVCTYEVKKDTCQGDSGGPLIWLDKSLNRYVLPALVSYGGECGGTVPGVNTDVSLFLDWIHKNIAASKPGAAACRKL